MATMESTGVLFVAHGTPASLEEIPAFLRNIRRGRDAPPAVVDEVRRRYEAIGGQSPLLHTTTEQARLTAQRLQLPFFVATRMWHPYPAEALRRAAEQGIRRLLVLTLAPHSAFIYEPVVRQAAAELAQAHNDVPSLTFAPCLGLEPMLVDALAELTRSELANLDPKERSRTVLVPSAHSLPMRTIDAGDPYARMVAQTADELMKRLDRDALPSILAFQSQGMTQEPWLGPDLPTVFNRVKLTGARSVMVVPVGFLADHVETLYDLDIEARQLAAAAGLELRRVPCLNTHPMLIDALEQVARRLL